MASRLAAGFRRLVGGVLDGPAGRMLLADEDRFAALPPQRYARAWIGLLGLSAAWGLIQWNLWGVSWRLFRDYEPLLMPAAVTAAVFCLLPYRRAVLALAGAVAGREPGGRALAVTVVVLLLAMCLARLLPDRYPPNWPLLPWWIGWLRPPMTLYRVLVLMPLWGTWGMLIIGKFCRPSERTCPQTAALARGIGAAAAAAVMGALLLATVGYFHHLGLGGQVGMPTTTILVAIGGGAVLCRRTGGPTRPALLATNLLTQLAFLLAAIACQ